jgi:predicted metal-binding membrane protein
MEKPTLIEGLLSRDRGIVAACLGAILLLSWLYILSGAGMDMSMPGMVMAPMAWSPVTAMLMLAMWWVMMIAMMVPSAAPMVMLMSAVESRKDPSGRPVIRVAIFLAGYLAAWGAFSALATALQWGLEAAGLMAMGMRLSSPRLGGAILLAAGLYQFTSIKLTCLRRCQSPLIFLSSHWRPGAGGAFQMGAHHGVYCLGCCWILMLLLFAGGIMNLLWIAGLALYVAVEKLLGRNARVARAAGVALCLAGLAVLGGAIGLT